MKCRGPKDNGEYINGECQKCPVCGRGKGHSKRCQYGEGAGATCRPCIEGKEFSQDSECHFCIDCASLNRQVKYKCRPRLNAECGKCLQGYFDAYGFEGTKCTHCSFRASHPHCSNYTRTNRLKATPTPLSQPVSYAHILRLGKDPSLYANNSSSNDTEYDFTNGQIVGISVAAFIFLIIAGVVYRMRRRISGHCCGRRRSMSFTDSSHADFKTENVATDHKSQDMTQFWGALPHTERESVPSTNITGATKSVKDQNPELRVLLLEDGRQKASPDLRSSRDNLHGPTLAGRDAILNNSTSPSRSTPSPPICTLCRQNSGANSNAISSPNRMSSSMELDETEGAIHFSNGIVTCEHADPILSRISRARNNHPASRKSHSLRHEEALRKGAKIRTGDLPQNIIDDLDMFLKETDVAGDKNYKHVADWLKLSGVTPLIRNNLKCMKDVIKHMDNEEKKLDELMECLQGLHRLDALNVLEDYCLNIDVRVDENDVGGPLLQETGDDKREIAVPMAEPSVTTKLLPG